MSERDENRDSAETNEDRSGSGEHEEHAPRRADEQKGSVPERPVRPDEEAGESVEQLEDPPQAEGGRDT